MFWRPAKSRSATNGVVFQTSARITGTHAVPASMNHTIGACKTPTLTSTVFTIPDCPSNMKRHRSPATTVGMAQGIRTAARTRPRPRKARFKASASQRPTTSSSPTLVTAKNKVCPSAPQNRGSLSASA